MEQKKKHLFHLVDYSPWPLLVSLGAFFFTMFIVLITERLEYFFNDLKSFKAFKKNKNKLKIKNNYNVLGRRYYNTTKINKNIINKKFTKIKQFVVVLEKLQKALSIYEKESRLIFIDRISTAFLFIGWISLSLCLVEVNYLFFNLFILTIISIFIFTIGFCLNIYIYNVIYKYINIIKNKRSG